ncbi:MAG: molybdopterin-dependent oxidoreductase, partial [Deltaproteobacteria bacterium]|nr:molybdopterin-dependent oxidoreductase [Deltaproteobacteria bacterium]
MKRRDFLKFLGIGGAGTGLGFVIGKVSQTPGAKLIPYLVPPEEIVPGVANWYASLCGECNSGCGIIVRVMEGRAKKIEGNPNHPVSKGGLCARGQASLQGLYNPDRIKGPLKRKGERGSGEYAEVTWDEAFAELTKNLSELRKSGEANKFYLLTSQLHGHLNQLVNNFMSGFGSPNLIQYELFQNRNLVFANQATMGLNAIPHYNIENTKYLLSFGADFGSTWLSPVNFSKGYGKMRQGEGARGKFVQIEPRISVTGANADEWVPAKPGTEAILALGIAHAIIEKGYYRGGEASVWRAVLSAYRPKEIAEITDVKEERIYGIAKEFTQTRPSLAVGGEALSSYENGVSGLVAINILNHLAGNLGVKGGVLPNPDDPLRAGVDLNKRITALSSAVASSKVKALALYNTNPVFTTPKAAKLEDSLKNIPFIVSFSSFMDETTALADLILPAHTFLEDWGDDFAEPAA